MVLTHEIASAFGDAASIQYAMQYAIGSVSSLSGRTIT